MQGGMPRVWRFRPWVSLMVSGFCHMQSIDLGKQQMCQPTVVLLTCLVGVHSLISCQLHMCCAESQPLHWCKVWLVDFVWVPGESVKALTLLWLLSVEGTCLVKCVQPWFHSKVQGSTPSPIEFGCSACQMWFGTPVTLFRVECAAVRPSDSNSSGFFFASLLDPNRLLVNKDCCWWIPLLQPTLGHS